MEPFVLVVDERPNDHLGRGTVLEKDPIQAVFGEVAETIVSDIFPDGRCRRKLHSSGYWADALDWRISRPVM